MAEVNNVPQLVDKKGGNLAAIPPKLELGKFNKWKKLMLCYLARMEPYYIKCIKDGLFQPKIDEDDIIESIISCETAKVTWTDLVYSFEGPSYTKENRIMDLKLEYQTFKAKPTESLSQPYTRYMTLLNELVNDGVNIFKHEINVGFMNSLSEKWLTFSQGLRNGNHTQTLDLADIYERFVYEDNLIQRSIQTPKGHHNYSLNTSIYTAFFLTMSYRVSKKILMMKLMKAQEDYKAEYKKLKAKITLLEANPSTSQTPKTFQPKNKGLVAKTFDWDEEEVSDDEEVTQVKVLMALADDELTIRKNHARNCEWIDITMKKINILLSMDEDVDRQNYLKYINIDLKFVEEQRLNLLSMYNKIVFELNKCRDELLILKQAMLDAINFQIQNTELTKVSKCISEQIPHQKKKVLGGELFTESSSIMNEKENLFVPASMGHDQEMVPKTKDWVERLNLDNKLPNFNTERILVPESKNVNEFLKSIKTSNTSESSKDFKAETLTPLPLLKNLLGASSSLEMLIDENVNSTQKTQESNSRIQQTESSKILYYMICKMKDHMTSDHEMYTASLKRSKNYKAQPYQYASSSKQILKAKAKPFLPCIHCGFNNHRLDDCRNYLKCGICGSYNHFTSGHNHVIHIRGGILAESSKSSKSLIGVKCNTCRSTVHFTTDHNDFDHFKRDEKIQFYRNKVWTLVPLPYGNIAIGSKWVFKNKKDEHGITTKNKARLVAQGYSQKEGIDYDETFTPVSAKKQQLVAMSSVEAEYVVAAGCCANILWMKSQLSDYDIYYKMVPIFCDNTSAIAISNNLFLYSRTKHIDIRYHFIRDHILKGDIELHFILIEYHLADIFTKPLDEPTFTRLKVGHVEH
uniref:Retrovirus-related Pol polyprotein from transposon TNT 1-94 n=1 Tax=Tanacetum cinerariifolium TaxID=118510 RepID=A0A699GHF8_TANCI|nr:retrovirus-related Pol polyprotein from transposon TNT 1-94 [Tanacetum cinerariifolium]